MEPLLQFWRRYRQNRGAVFGLAIVLTASAMALLAPWLFPGDPRRIAGAPYIAPFVTWQFPLGTDQLGRDIYVQLFYGARVSLLVGIAASLVTALIGCTIGALAGFYGGRLGALLMRGTEMFQTIPDIMLALVLVTILQASLLSVIISIAIVSWTTVARVTRAEFLKFRSQDFVLACVVMGMPSWRIIVSQIFPNVLPPIVVMTSIIAAGAILAESSLSFLGLGDPNSVSWGMMTGAGRSVFRNAWYVSGIPGLAILMAVLGINLVSDGLNDALNPRRRER